MDTLPSNISTPTYLTSRHKLIGKLLAENEASRALAARYGFREVGLHLRHGETGGRWHDVMVVELLLT